MQPVTITVLGEPVAKARPRMTRTGRPYTPTTTRHYEALLRLAATREMAGRAPFDEPVAMDFLATLPIPASWSQRKQQAAIRGEIRPGKRPDLDNLEKACADALNAVVFRDDSLIVEKRSRKVYGPQPGIVVTVRPACPA